MAEVAKNDKIAWKDVRELAQKIDTLYDSKKLEGNRVTDEYAKTRVQDSREIGCVELLEDPTSPFKANKLGEELKEDLPGTSGKMFYQRFDFGYEDDYEGYVEKRNKLPILYSQYLVKKESDTTFGKDIFVTPITSVDLRNLIDTDVENVNNLIECPMEHVKKFWDYGKSYFDTEDPDRCKTNYNYSPGKSCRLAQSAANLYGIVESVDGVVEDPSTGKTSSLCNGLVRFAFVGTNGNGNANSMNPTTDKRPLHWVSGDIYPTYSANKQFGGDGYVVSTGEDPVAKDNKDKNYVLSLTGVSWDNNLAPERPSADGYICPPAGCCGQRNWPIIGYEGGSTEPIVETGQPRDKKDVSVYIKEWLTAAHQEYSVLDWCDWRPEYRKPLTAAERDKSMESKPGEHQPDGYFRAGYAGEITEDITQTNILYEDYSGDTIHDAWVQINAGHAYPYKAWARIRPIQFTVGGKFACVNAVVSIVVGFKLKSIQTAIRKRWYDMLYYSLRNIAGYKYNSPKKRDGKIIEPIEPEEAATIIGVTWNDDTRKELMPNEYYPTLTLESSTDRWKALHVGNMAQLNDEGNAELKAPFVGKRSDYATYAYNPEDPEYNAAQMWLYDDAFELDYPKLDVDIHFCEPYFERFIAAKNASETTSERYWVEEAELPENKGGFPIKLKKPEDGAKWPMPLDLSNYKLPWELGGDSTSCGSEENEKAKTHAYTLNALNRMCEFISTNKLSEDVTENHENLGIGMSVIRATHSTDECDGGAGVQLITRTAHVKDSDCTKDTTFSLGCVNITITDPEKGYNSEIYNTPIAKDQFATAPAPEEYVPGSTAQSNGTAIINPNEIMDDFGSNIPIRDGYNSYTWKDIDPGGTGWGTITINLTTNRRKDPSARDVRECVGSLYSEQADEPMGMFNPDTSEDASTGQLYISLLSKEYQYSLRSTDATISWAASANEYPEYSNGGVSDTEHITGLTRNFDIFIAPVIDTSGNITCKHLAAIGLIRNGKTTLDPTCGGSGFGYTYGTSSKCEETLTPCPIVTQTYTEPYLKATQESIPEEDKPTVTNNATDKEYLDLSVTIPNKELFSKFKDNRRKHIIISERYSTAPVTSWLYGAIDEENKINEAETPDWLINWLLYQERTVNAHFPNVSDNTSYQFSQQ